jgi:replication-associated recombination protein RarA
MALLQKAIHRGRQDLALQAVVTLLVDPRDRLWRRCSGVTFEDIGIADPEVLGLMADPMRA